MPFPASERVVVSSARNAYVAVNPSDGTGFEAPAGHAQWIGRVAPTTLLFGAGAIAATSFAFDATIIAFDVTPDGGTAAVGFAKNAGSEATATGPTYVTLLKHEPRKWILYEANDDRNPFKGQFAVMSDGEWYLKFHRSGNGEIWVGASGTSWAQRAWTGNEFPEYLDFSHGYSYKAVDNERHPINGNEQYGFATNSVVGKGPRVIVHSPTMTFFNDKCKGWSGEGNFEEVVIDCPNLNWGASWSGPDKQSQRIVYNFASMPTGYATMIYPNNNNYFGGEGDWSEVTLTAKPNATGSFVQWYGDVSRADERNAQITVTIDGDMWLYCRIVHPWTLSSDSEIRTYGAYLQTPTSTTRGRSGRLVG